MIMLFIKKKQDDVMRSKRKGQDDHGRHRRVWTQAETRRSAEPAGRTAGKRLPLIKSFLLSLTSTQPRCWIEQCFPFPQ